MKGILFRRASSSLTPENSTPWNFQTGSQPILLLHSIALSRVVAGGVGERTRLALCFPRPRGKLRPNIVAVFSQGDDDNLMVGRNGLFYDRKGRDWDATITKILSNPISLRQAFWAPYKKLVRMIEEQIAKRAAAADAASTSKLQSAAATVATADKAKPAEPTKKVGNPPVATPVDPRRPHVADLCAFLVLAFMKLRKRNLGPILDAYGWAVNAKARINVPFGTSLTGIAKLPPGSSVDISDRFAQKSAAWPKVLIVLLFVI